MLVVTTAPLAGYSPAVARELRSAARRDPGRRARALLVGLEPGQRGLRGLGPRRPPEWLPLRGRTPDRHAQRAPPALGVRDDLEPEARGPEAVADLGHVHGLVGGSAGAPLRPLPPPAA